MNTDWGGGEVMLEGLEVDRNSESEVTCMVVWYTYSFKNESSEVFVILSKHAMCNGPVPGVNE